MIIVNGRSKIWNDPTISYAQVIDQAHDKRAGAQYTVAWTVKFQNRCGTLAPGESMKIEKFLVFNVSAAA